MRIKSLAIVAFAGMALASATGAFATVTCGTPVQTAPGVVEMQVTTDAVFVFLVVVEDTGGVTVDSGDCVPGVSSCTWQGIGTPGLTPQSITANIVDSAGGSADCTMTDGDGLPVELIEFSVE